MDSTQGRLPVWTALMPPSHQESPLTSYTKRQTRNYTYGKSISLPITSPLTPMHIEKSLLYKCKSKSLLKTGLTTCELKIY